MSGNGHNDYGVPFSCINFFEDRLLRHSMVKSVTRTNDILFHLTLINKNYYDVLLVNDYTISESAVFEYHRAFPSAEFIVTGASWNAYTSQAKEAGNDLNIGVFNSSEFFGALHWDEPKKYHKKDRNGNPIYATRK